MTQRKNKCLLITKTCRNVVVPLPVQSNAIMLKSLRKHPFNNYGLNHGDQKYMKMQYSHLKATLESHNLSLTSMFFSVPGQIPTRSIHSENKHKMPSSATIKTVVIKKHKLYLSFKLLGGKATVRVSNSK